MSQKRTSKRVFIWHLVDLKADKPATICGIGEHPGAKRRWQYGHEGFMRNPKNVTCSECLQIHNDKGKETPLDVVL